ncbi:MAG: hypothetical protein AWU58_726 [Methanohalophilus sp. T328-1]|nr:MAG: hypothetical protein AWU58_726 [Methanohalophilus sp. T328-1]
MYAHIFKYCAYLCINMASKQKITGFRLPDRTLERLDYLVECGVASNRTQAAIVAIEHLATEYEGKKYVELE